MKCSKKGDSTKFHGFLARGSSVDTPKVKSIKTDINGTLYLNCRRDIRILPAKGTSRPWCFQIYRGLEVS